MSLLSSTAHTVFLSNTDNPSTQLSPITRKRLSFSPTRRQSQETLTKIQEPLSEAKPNKNDQHSGTVALVPLECTTKNTKFKMTAKQCRYILDGQRLLSSRPIVATPPRKKRKTRAQSQHESKKSSPLNQILKQRKRTRPSTFKSPSSKRVNIERTENKPSEVTYEDINSLSCPRGLEIDDCSQSSEDMLFSWVTGELENSTNKRTSSEEYGDDSVFQESSSFRRPREKTYNPVSPINPKCLFMTRNSPTLSPTSHSSGAGYNSKKQTKEKTYKPVTPISAKSLRMLQESPILSPTSRSTSLITNRWSDSTPNDICAQLSERLKRRKRSEALGQTSSTDEDTSESELGSLRYSKRLKLASS